MSDEACPLPSDPAQEESEIIERLLNLQRIAVIGASADESRPGHYVPDYLKSHGYEIIPINPNVSEIFGTRSYPSLADLPQPPEVALVFRRAELCADVAAQAVAAGVKGIWLQSGIVNDEARRLAEKAGIYFVQNRCMMMEHRSRR